MSLSRRVTVQKEPAPAVSSLQHLTLQSELKYGILPNYPHSVLPQQSRLSFKYVRVVSIRAVENENQRVSCLMSYWGPSTQNYSPVQTRIPISVLSHFPPRYPHLPPTIHVFQSQPSRSLIFMLNAIIWLNQMEFQRANRTGSRVFPPHGEERARGLDPQCKSRTEENPQSF